MSITNLLSYQELDDDTKSLYTIDDIWDNENRTFKQKKLFQISRVSGNIVLTANKNDANYFRIVCRDPRVGCVLYKMHILNPTDISKMKPKKEEKNNKNNIIKRVDTKVYTTDYFYKEQIKYADTVYGRRLRIRGASVTFKENTCKTPSVQHIKAYRRSTNGV